MTSACPAAWKESRLVGTGGCPEQSLTLQVSLSGTRRKSLTLDWIPQLLEEPLSIAPFWSPDERRIAWKVSGRRADLAMTGRA